jgi:hypothetical protein
MKIAFLPILILAIALSGCTSSKDVFAEKLTANSDNSSQISDAYLKGQKLIDQGTKMERKGAKEIKSGESRVNKGEVLKKQGADLQLQAKVQFCTERNFVEPECAQYQ